MLLTIGRDSHYLECGRGHNGQRRTVWIPVIVAECCCFVVTHKVVGVDAQSVIHCGLYIRHVPITGIKPCFYSYICASTSTKKLICFNSHSYYLNIIVTIYKPFTMYEYGIKNTHEIPIVPTSSKNLLRSPRTALSWKFANLTHFHRCRMNATQLAKQLPIQLAYRSAATMRILLHCITPCSGAISTDFTRSYSPSEHKHLPR